MAIRIFISKFLVAAIQPFIYFAYFESAIVIKIGNETLDSAYNEFIGFLLTICGRNF